MAFGDKKANSDYDPEFARLMENRMLTSFHKYGAWKDNRPKVDAIKNIKLRIDHYLKTGNTEGLVDAANFCMMEWALPIHPKAHFRAEESGESPSIAKF